MSSKSTQDRLIVVKHQPGFWRRLRLQLVTVAVVAAAGGYLLGQYEIRERHERALSRLDNLAQQHAGLRSSEASLRQQVANLESGRAIDERAKLEIQSTIQALRAEVAQLQKDVSFYKNIMAPNSNLRGLQLQKVEISETSISQRFGYKIVLTQVADNKSYVSGVVAVNVIGYTDGSKEVLPLRDISELEELGIKFRFKYFQDITGEMVLPEGFQPESLQVVAQSSGKKASRLEQSLAWQQLLNGGR
ncbi:MAG: DUF6776 family protein [Oleiphilaceae bacterium]|nr:DUF6776 family protein [Oleiphilaceae bacterium]